MSLRRMEMASLILTSPCNCGGWCGSVHLAHLSSAVKGSRETKPVRSSQQKLLGTAKRHSSHRHIQRLGKLKEKLIWKLMLAWLCVPCCKQNNLNLFQKDPEAGYKAVKLVHDCNRSFLFLMTHKVKICIYSELRKTATGWTWALMVTLLKSTTTFCENYAQCLQKSQKII